MRKAIEFSVIVSFLLLFSCQQNRQITETETSGKTIQTEQTPGFSIENLSPAQKENLDKVFSPPTREILEKAEKFVLNSTYAKKSEKNRGK